MPLPRFQFSLRTLFYIVTVAAVYAFLFRQVGWFEATVLMSAIVIVTSAIRWRRPHWSMRLLMGMFGLMIIWFVAVDRSWFVEDCPDCMTIRDRIQIRVLHFPIHETVYEYRNNLAIFARELGVPCTHPDLTAWHKHRRWGLLICRAPCINGIYALIGPEMIFDQPARDRLKRLVEQSPDLLQEFQRRVLKNHEWPFWQQSMGEVFPDRNKAEAQAPEAPAADDNCNCDKEHSASPQHDN